jgi:hypothetical protein
MIIFLIGCAAISLALRLFFTMPSIEEMEDREQIEANKHFIDELLEQ